MIGFLYPEITLVAASLIILLVGVFVSKSYAVSYYVTIVTLITSILATYLPNDAVLSKYYITTDLVTGIKRLILILSLAVFVMTRRRANVFEFSSLFLLAVTGFLVTVSASSSILLFLGLELQALPIYVIIAIDKNIRSSEAGLKYYLLGSIASAVILYGFSILYGISGSIDLHAISSVDPSQSLFYMTGVVMVLGGMFFKMSAFPAYMWLADVYRGSTSIVIMLISVLPKISVFVGINRFLHDSDGNFIYYLISITALLTILIGLLGALWQKNFRKMLAYSSVQQVGYVMLLITSIEVSSVEVAILYMLIYGIMIIGVLTCMMRLGSEKIIADLNISDLAGLVHRDKLTAIGLAILFFSMAGIPPAAGFFAKIFLFSEALKEGMNVAIVMASVMSVAAMFYYLRVVKAMFFDEMQENSTVALRKDKLETTVIILCLAISVGLIFKPDIALMLVKLN